MRTPLKQFFLIAALLPPLSGFAADGHFSLPPGTPAGNPVPGSFGGGSIDRAPTGCDAASFLAWARAWRQSKREGYAKEVARDIPSLTQGARCIKNPDAFDAQYIPGGDYWIVSCLAQKGGTLSHFFQMDIDSGYQDCLSDARLNDYVKGNECRMPGGNQRFLEQVMKPCGIGTIPPTLHGGAQPRATPIDPSFWARLLNDRPALSDIIDQSTRRVKVGPSSSGGGSDCASNPFLCPAAKPKSGDDDGDGTSAQ